MKKCKFEVKVSLALVLTIIMAILNSCGSTQSSNINFASDQINAKCGDNLEWKIEDGTLSIFGQGNMYDFDEALSQWIVAKEEIVKINIGDEVTSIGKNAFNGLSNVKEIAIGNSVTSIGTGALSETQIVSLTIPESVCEIKGNPFTVYSEMSRQIVIDENNKHFVMKDNVIYSKDLTKLICSVDYDAATFTAPQTVTEIADYAFAYQQLEEIRFSDNLQLIGDGAFKQCENLKTADIGKCVIWIGEEAFGGTQIQSINLGDKLKGISKKAFLYCESLRSIMFGESTEFIGEEAFVGCTALENVEMIGVQTVGDRAFYDCDSLKNIFIPNTVTDIGKEAFGFRAIGATDTAKVEDFVLECNKDSVAHIYAQESGIQATVIVTD